MTRRQSKAARVRDYVDQYRPKRARRIAPARPPLPAHAVARLGAVSDRAIAAELGIPTRHVAAERQARGIKPVHVGRKLRAGVRASVGRTIWLTPAEAAAHDAAAARAGMAWSPWMVGLANAAAAGDAACLAGTCAHEPGYALCARNVGEATTEAIQQAIGEIARTPTT